MARIIGVDLGSHSVKLAVMTGAFGRFEVEEYLAEELPEGEHDLPARLECLESMLASLPTDERITSAAAFPTEHSSVRLISLPFSDKKQIQQTLGFEVEGQVPFDLDEMLLTHRVLDSSPEGSRVVAALSARDRVGHLLTGLSETGTDPRSLVIDGDVLGDHASSGIQAIVDIGHQRTIVTVCKDGSVCGTRAISLAGAHLTQALVDARSIPWSEAEDLKHRTALRTSYDAEAEWEEDNPTGSSTPTEQPASTASDSSHESDILREALQPLLASLRATLINFEDSLGVEIDEVLLAGGTANLGGLTRVLKVDLGVRVRRVSVSDMAHAAGKPARYALSHALARRAAGISSGEEMELRRDSFKFRGDLANMKNTILGSIVALAAVFLMGIGFAAWKSMDYKSEIERLDMEIATVVADMYKGEISAEEVGGPQEALTKLQAKALETMELIDLLGASVDEIPPVVSTVHDLSNAMPASSKARIDVRELTITQRSLNLDAETDTYDSASTIEASLQAHQRFKRAVKGDDKKVRDGIRFSISVPLGDADSSSEEG